MDRITLEILLKKETIKGYDDVLDELKEFKLTDCHLKNILDLRSKAIEELINLYNKEILRLEDMEI